VRSASRAAASSASRSARSASTVDGATAVMVIGSSRGAASRTRRTIAEDAVRSCPHLGTAERSQRQAVRGAFSARVFFSELKLSRFAMGQNFLTPSEYSMFMTALPAFRNGFKSAHSWYWKHCSFSAQSK